MVAIALLVIAGSAVGWNLRKAVLKKQFQSELERLQVRFAVAQKFALSMQADWKGTFKKRKKEWLFELACEDGRAKKLSPLHLKTMEIFFDEKTADGLEIDFFSSGKVFPEGTFRFNSPFNPIYWKTSAFFKREEGKRLGPLHPNE